MQIKQTEQNNEAGIFKKRKFIRRTALFIGVSAACFGVYFLAFGAGNGFLKNSASAAARSFRTALGFSSSGNSGIAATEFVPPSDASSAAAIAASSSAVENGFSAGTDGAGKSGNNRPPLPMNGAAAVFSAPDGMQASVGENPVSDPEEDVADSAAPADSMADIADSSSTAMAASDTVDFNNAASGVFDGTGTDAGIADLSDVSSSAASLSTADFSDSLSILSPSSSKDAASSGKNIPPARRVLDSAALPSHRIVLNEIAWMGSPAQSGESAAAASNDEWMELKNETSGTIPLAGWQLLDAADNITVFFGDNDRIAPSSFFLLKRTDDNAIPGIPADKIYSGSLPNTGDTIGLFDGGCAPVDILNASSGWPGGDNGTKRTLERDISGFGWHTSANPGGTPKAENSAGDAASIAVAASSAADASPLVSSSTPKYTVAAAVAGDGAGIIVSEPAGISCGSDCAASFASGQTVTLHAIMASSSVFSGWSGPCSGTADCVFTVKGYVSATAMFHGAEDASAASSLEAANNPLNYLLTGDAADEASSSLSAPAADASSSITSVTDSGFGADGSLSSSSTASSTVSALSHVVIAAVQIAGASTTNDFVKIYNPENTAIDASGWKLRKKSSTGADYSLKEFPAGSIVPPGGMFAWANSADGFAASVGADVSSTATLSADNSVALFDAAGVMVDAVAWGTGVNQYSEGTAYPVNPAANQSLARITKNGAMVDTDDNAADFTIK